ncbi:MAG: sulfotransferase family 2 domain-containing protein [Alphaproteobacteria bacterium]|nr:sulfotransferase family 2 domain-containing protein [Alphaproteobacteria bacterium]
MFTKRIKKTAYRAWHRALFRLQGAEKSTRLPVQTIFVHVPKTAGSSINEYFSSFVGSRHAERYVPIDGFKGDAYDAGVSAEGVEAARKGLFVTGHIDWQTVETIRQPHAFVFTVLRDPAERLLSFYHYMHHIDENRQPTPGEKERLKKLKLLTFGEFCTSEDPALLYMTNNFMTRQLAGRLDGTAGTSAPFPDLLGRALQNLKTLDYAGFQQTLDADFQALVKKAGFPPLPLPLENITKKLAAHAGPSYNPNASKQDILTLAAPRLKWDMAFYQQALELAPEINKRPFRRG